MKKGLVLIVLALLLPAAFAIAAKAPVAGTLDRTFAGDGMIDFEAEQSGLGVAETRSGKIVQGRFPAIVARYTPRGRPDRSLGGDGTVRTRYHGKRFDPVDLLVDRKDRIVILANCRGCGKKGNYSWSALIRLLPNGQRDRSFARNGIAIHRFSEDFYSREIAFAPGGRIVAVSSSSREGSLVLRYRQNGRLDRGFSGNGILRFALGSGINEVSTVAVDKNGRIAFGFRARPHTKLNPRNRPRLGVARLLPNGRFDRSFSIDGTADFVVPDMGGGIVTQVTIDRRGRIVGTGLNGSLHAPFFRLTRNGRLDRSFAKNGIDQVAWTSVRSLSVDPKGRILVLGDDAPPYGGPSGAKIFRFGPNGSEDPNFRYRGTLYNVHDHFVDRRGRIVVSGSVYGGPALARLRNP